MKITVATGLYPPEIGGPATHTVLMEEHLPAYGHSVAAVPYRDSRRFPRVVRHAHYFFRLYRATKDTDIIFAQDVASVALPALLVARIRRKTLYVRVPGDYAWEQGVQRFGVKENIDDFQSRSYGLRVSFLRKVQQLVTKGADTVITPSDYFKRLVTGWGVPAEKIQTVYNGVDLTITPAAVQQPKQRTIVSAGRLVPWKGFAVLISCLRELPEWQLVILGEGPELSTLQKHAADEGVSDRVTFAGKVTREEVFGWCQAADVFALNTHFESFSYQVVEALASGVPVVTTRVGSLPEIVEHEKNGVLVSPDDAASFVRHIKSVREEPELWEERTNQARTTAKQFTVRQTMAALNTLFT